MPNFEERASAWKTAIGLQAVDGLQTSDYLKDTAVKHIEGDISIDEVKALINGYYQSKTVRTPNDEDTEEADKVSANIARILNEKSFAFQFIEGCLKVYSNLQVKSETMTSQRKNGCFVAIPYCMSMQKIYVGQ